MTTHYEILGIEENSTQDEVKKAHKTELLRWHPDRQAIGATKAELEDKAKHINEAYAILSDPDKRQAYDNELFRKKDFYQIPRKVDPSLKIGKDEQKLFNNLKIVDDLFGQHSISQQTLIKLAKEEPLKTLYDENYHVQRTIDEYKEHKDAPTLTRAKVYDALMNEWFESRAGTKIFDDPELVINYEAFSQLLAVDMDANKFSEVSAKNETLWRKYFSDDNPDMKTAREGCPLIKTTNGGYQFLTPTLIDYFVTKKIHEELLSKGGIGSEASAHDEGTTKSSGNRPKFS